MLIICEAIRKYPAIAVVVIVIAYLLAGSLEL